MHHNSTLPWSIYIDWRGVSATVWTVAVPLHKSLAGGFLYLFVRESICWSLLTTIFPNFPFLSGIVLVDLSSYQFFQNFHFFVQESILLISPHNSVSKFSIFCPGKHLLIIPHNSFSKFFIVFCPGKVFVDFSSQQFFQNLRTFFKCVLRILSPNFLFPY